MGSFEVVLIIVGCTIFMRTWSAIQNLMHSIGLILLALFISDRWPVSTLAEISSAFAVCCRSAAKLTCQCSTGRVSSYDGDTVLNDSMTATSTRRPRLCAYCTTTCMCPHVQNTCPHHDYCLPLFRFNLLTREDRLASKNAPVADPLAFSLAVMPAFAPDLRTCATAAMMSLGFFSLAKCGSVGSTAKSAVAIACT
jgi:hypothetical protein